MLIPEYLVEYELGKNAYCVDYNNPDSSRIFYGTINERKGSIRAQCFKQPG